MIVVLANPQDAAARALVERWGAAGARLMLPGDLSVAGWQHHVGCEGEDWAVVGGEPVKTREIRAVLTRLPMVREQDLSHIAADDRSYVASEMNAFLISWLTRIRGTVLNRPSASSLMGPSLSHERWLMLAAAAGIPVGAATYRAPRGVNVLSGASVTVVGDRCLGNVAPELGAQALRLAEHAGVELITVRFSAPDGDGRLTSVDLLVDLSSDAIADAVLARLTRFDKGKAS